MKQKILPFTLYEIAYNRLLKFRLPTHRRDAHIGFF